MASVLSVPDNQSEDKHVESSLVPRLDEGSNPSSSTIYIVFNKLLISGIKSGTICFTFNIFFHKILKWYCLIVS